MRNNVKQLVSLIILLSLSLALITYNLFYYYLDVENYSPVVSAAIGFVILIFWFILVLKWYGQPYYLLIKRLKEHISNRDCDILDDNVAEKINEAPYVVFEEIINHYIEQDNQQKELMQKLIKNNNLLQRNNKVIHSIMQITNKILFSGDIDSILQTILNKAVELIPNAQRGSIVLYNGSYMEYRAVKGYDINKLNGFKLKLEESFQNGAKDFYEPIIISNADKFNREHLSTDRYEFVKNEWRHAIKSVISCAIPIDEETFGIINIDNTDDFHAFSEESKPLIKNLAVQTGIALKNAMLIEKIIYLSRFDSLTKIYNRNYFEELLNNVRAECKAGNKVFSLALMDINDLKYVNDTYGHEAGDNMIVHFAHTMSKVIQKPDIFARIGGDEFTAVFIGKNREQAEEIINEAARMMECNPVYYNLTDSAKVTFARGIATYPEDSVEISPLMKVADHRMYNDKRTIKKVI